MQLLHYFGWRIEVMKFDKIDVFGTYLQSRYLFTQYLKFHENYINVMRSCLRLSRNQILFLDF